MRITSPEQPRFAPSAKLDGNRSRSDVYFSGRTTKGSSGTSNTPVEGLIGKLMKHEDSSRFASNVASSAVGSLVGGVINDALIRHRENRVIKESYEIIKPKKMENISFDDIVGHDDIKEQLQEFLERQKYPHLYEQLYQGDARGANNYVLLTGRPGTGKTLLAKAVAANQKDATFINVHCENLSLLTGHIGLTRLEKKFKNIASERLVFFFDEMDALGERDKVVTWLLKMLDGMEQFKDQEVMMLAASNYPENLDFALRNRFHQTIEVMPPSHSELVKMYHLYFDKKGLTPGDDVDLEAISSASAGLTGRKVEQITSLVKERCIRRLSSEQREALNNEIHESKKKFFKKKKTAVPSIELKFTQKDVLRAIRASATLSDTGEPLTHKMLDLGA